MIEKFYTAEEILQSYPDSSHFSIFMEAVGGTYRWLDNEFQRVPEDSHDLGIVFRNDFTKAYNAARAKATETGLQGELEFLAFQLIIR
jgi:hypothetical protein